MESSSEWRGTDIFSHVSDVRIERTVERVQLCVGAQGPEQPA